jgi:hypothetical protein
MVGCNSPFRFSPLELWQEVLPHYAQDSILDFQGFRRPLRGLGQWQLLPIWHLRGRMPGIEPGISERLRLINSLRSKRFIHM